MLYDLSDQAIAYTPFFVTTANLATTANGPLIVDGTNVPIGLAGVVSGPGGVTVSSGGALQLSATNSYTGPTTIAAGGQLLVSGPGSIASSSGVINNGVFDITRGWQAETIQALTGSGQVFLGSQNLTITNASGTFSGTIADNGSYPGPGGSITYPGTGGSVTILGGTQTLSGANTYTGGTILNGGSLILTGSLASGVTVGSGSSLTNSGTITGGVVNAGTAANSGTIIGTVLNSGAFGNSGTILGNVGNSGLLLNSGTILGSIANTGLLGGNGTFIGNFANGGVLNSNGTFFGNVLNTGFLGGNPIIVGNLANSGILSPGNSIGTITVAGNAALASSTSYNVEVNAQGQNDALSVGGATTIQGGTVAVTPLNGVYAPRTTYSIVNSSGGVSGSFGSVSSSNPFLLPSLSYGANNVFLTITIGGFLAAAQNPVQAAVGGALDGSVLQASGDYAQVLGNLASSNPSQVPAILTSLSGMNYSGFSNSMVQTAQLFMSNFSDMAGGTARGRNKVALAEACDVACDTTEPAKWGAWGGGLGGLGTVGSGSSLGGVTYNVGGFAGGLDRRFTDNFLAGVALGYTTGSQWVSGFSGQGFSNTVDVGVYGSWLQGPIYLDGIVGYAYSGNQLNRSINIPGMAGRTAVGQAGANQAYGQLESGYRFDLGTNAEAFITPFARLQG
ncbi:MAG: autotransporter domain-containing protein, partial [Alphaproteobacteria bacterium]|nr:autotransporter domain-containing protein [Alphaproteobacteria bacterium]